MTRSSNKELVEPYNEPEQALHSLRKLSNTTSFDHSSSSKFELFSDHERQFEEEIIETMTKPPMEEYEVILFYKGLDVPTREILNSKGGVPKIAAIQAQLNNLGREIKKVNERVYAAQVGCELCNGPHYTKDCPLKEEGKTLKEAYYTQGIPFPYLLKENGYDEKEVLKELKKLKVNSTESATSLRRLLKEKSRINEEIKATMKVHWLEILKDALPPKEKDTVIFTLPYSINNMCFDKALADLGASFRVMPSLTFTNLVLGKLALTKLIIDMGDKTVKRPEGIAENVLAGIDKFVFLVDFIVLDMPEDIKIPLFLGRLFLSTAHAKIDVFKRKFALRIRNDKIVFNIDNPTCNIIKKAYVLGLRDRMELDLEARLMGEALILN
uniref:Reverse transcriptase domain-containing protein n=1 Tax=Tanacetum cinerariifolium TaxID=118510 RepID=A0A6L2JMC3_TANCI|nr:hypothetical protein [Tanacetum cinerariifolium]